MARYKVGDTVWFARWERDDLVPIGERIIAKVNEDHFEMDPKGTTFYKGAVYFTESAGGVFKEYELWPDPVSALNAVKAQLFDQMTGHHSLRPPLLEEAEKIAARHPREYKLGLVVDLVTHATRPGGAKKGSGGGSNG